MAGGLAALLDDIAALARLAAASVDDIGAAAGRASVKAAGVVVDDTAVTPRYLHGFSPARELPVVWKIAKGSLRNKLVLILPAILLLSQLLPALLTPILMVGGLYLSFEGAEKLYEYLTGHHRVATAQPASAAGAQQEQTMVRGAVRTDLILSAEIMVIALNEVDTEPLLSRALILVVVALAITALVYGVVALIVKMDDIGLRLAERSSALAQRVGRLLVKGMPSVLAVLSVVGVVAMLWVGGHILLAGVADLGWHGPHALVHRAEEAVAGGLGALRGFVTWLVNTAASAVVGVVVGSVVLAVMHVLPRRRRAAAGH